MRILLVVATADEIFQDQFHSHEVLITGVGMVNTSIKLTKYLLKNDVDLVVNMGVAGSFHDNLSVGDVVEVIEDNFSEIGFENGNSFENFSDFDIETNYCVKTRTDLAKVKSITVNTVHGNDGSISEIIKRINPDIESMEGAAVFKVCKEFSTACIQIRSVSNKIEKRDKSEWDLPLAIANLNKIVNQIILQQCD